MDKRKGSTHARSRGRVEGQSGHPGSSRRKGRPMTTGRGRNGRSGTRRAKKVNRARKRRNKILFVMIIILLIMILAQAQFSLRDTVHQMRKPIKNNIME